MTDCAWQLRGGGAEAPPYGLDFGAVLSVGAARGVDMMLLSTVLPDIERAIITNLHADGETDGGGDDG
ncbi:MAG: hypothetical protein FJ335_11935 [Sphingomonadales bacterium]|nr:hypothetical protein [Sphingomonadales bacterium]